MAKTAKPGTGTPTDDDDDDEVSPKLLDVINNTVTAAVTAQIGRKLKPINDQITQLGATITEQLEAMQASRGGGAPVVKKQGDPDPGAGAGAQPDPDKIAMKKRLDAIEEERKQERNDARNARRDARLTELAVTAGVEKNRVRGAVAVLREQTFFDKEGNAMMKIARTGYDEDADLDTGSAEWFKSDEGKSYLAPQGATQQRGTTQQRGSTAATVVQRGGGGAAAAGSSNRQTTDAKAAKTERKEKALADLAEGIGALIGGGSIDIG